MLSIPLPWRESADTSLLSGVVSWRETGDSESMDFCRRESQKRRAPVERVTKDESQSGLLSWRQSEETIPLSGILP